MAWPPDLVVTTQTRRVELASSVWVTGNLESVGGILIKIWTNFNKNRDNTPTYLLDTATKKLSLEIMLIKSLLRPCLAGHSRDKSPRRCILGPVFILFYYMPVTTRNDSCGLQPIDWDQIRRRVRDRTDRRAVRTQESRAPPSSQTAGLTHWDYWALQFILQTRCWWDYWALQVI